MAKKMQRRRRQKRTHSQRGEFPLSLVDRFLPEGNHSGRLSSSAPVILDSVLEYLSSNILELAGEVAYTTGRKRIAPEDVGLVVQNNEQLCQLFKPGATSVFDPPEPDDN
ncbi:histone cluster 2 family member [Mus musculus]|jgi:histone H2A|uniref:Histone H2A n=1 Tax=Mus musculus TaxID=10090 RepID=A2BFR3_MOUSE|nr:histone cluster 2 family member [Mus musculus]|eukprot:NP_001108001.1 histone cluster 2 family member [Mus musculus]